MKFIFLKVFVVLLFLQSSTFASGKKSFLTADKEETVVKVKLQNAAGCRISIMSSLTNQTAVKDSLYQAKDGYQVYTLKPDYGTITFLTIKYPAAKMVQQKGIPVASFLLKKGATITIEGDADMPAFVKVTSADQDVVDFQVFRTKEAAIEMEYWQSIKVKLNPIKQQNSGQVDFIKEALQAMSSKRGAWEKEFVKLYPHSYAGLQIFYRYYQRIDKNTALAIFNEFPKSFSQDGAGAEIARYFDAIRHTAAGNQVLAFRQQGMDGKMIDTDSLKGKVVIIDFWGSWCGPCRKSHPHLKALYEKYHDRGLEIIGIASEGGTPEGLQLNWRKAVGEDGLPWLQVLNDPKGIDLVSKYAVTAFPTKLVVDRKGTIVLRVNNSIPEELDRKLEELFK